jgi:hypothetical protein
MANDAMVNAINSMSHRRIDNLELEVDEKGFQSYDFTQEQVNLIVDALRYKEMCSREGFARGMAKMDADSTEIQAKLERFQKVMKLFKSQVR